MSHEGSVSTQLLARPADGPMEFRRMSLSASGVDVAPSFHHFFSSTRRNSPMHRSHSNA